MSNFGVVGEKGKMINFSLENRSSKEENIIKIGKFRARRHVFT